MLRSCYLVLLALVLAAQTGCCGLRPWPCGRTWYGCNCGEFYWNEWFSHPPCCKDPCDDCDQFTGRVRPVRYSQGTSDPITPASPVPAESLPEPNAGVFRNEFGELVSYNEPVDSPAPSRTLERPRPLQRAAR